MKTNRQGFTLVEIMIAVSIVAVVFGLIISSSAAIRKRSRDAQRQADLRMIQTALQQFYTDRNHFPNDFTPISTGLISGVLTDCSNEPTSPACTISKTYLSTIPADPSGVDQYKYRSKVDTASGANNCGPAAGQGSGTCHSYILCAKLEGSSPQAAGDYAECQTQFGSAYNFQIKP